MTKALGLYRGKMLKLAQECYQLSEYCKKKRVHNNLFLNDRHVFSLLLHSDLHQDSFFHEDLIHGIVIEFSFFIFIFSYLYNCYLFLLFVLLKVGLQWQD